MPLKRHRMKLYQQKELTKIRETQLSSCPTASQVLCALRRIIRWLSPQEALAAGLVDRIIEPATTEKTPAAQATPAGQWRKLLGKLGLVRPADALPPDRNILHFGDPEKGSGLRTSELALHEGQQFAAPTRTLPREDPSIGETTPSANQRAYAEDAKQLIR